MFVFMIDLCRRQFDQMTTTANQHGDELRSSKGEIAELKRIINRLQNEIQAVKGQVRERFLKCLMC